MSKLYANPIRGTTSVVDATSGSQVLHANDPHALIQAAGYLKYVHAKEDKMTVHFRGQSRVYNTFSPTIYRKIGQKKASGHRVKELSKYIDDVHHTHTIFRTFPRRVTEPLLQHYGIHTTWIDLVENIWIALWFSCHKAHAIGHLSKFLHFEKRVPRHEHADHRYAYILLVGCDIAVMEWDVPGLFRGPNTELIDLRMAAPSVFTRPHAQHGVLFRLRGRPLLQRLVDYSSAVVGIIRISLDDALDWLGDGTLLNTHNLFPPPVYDLGYRILLSEDIPHGRHIGDIHHVGS